MSNFNYSEISRINMFADFHKEVTMFGGDTYNITADNIVDKLNGEDITPFTCDERLMTTPEEKEALTPLMKNVQLCRFEDGDVVLIVTDCRDNQITARVKSGHTFSDELKMEFFNDAKNSMLEKLGTVYVPDKDEYFIHAVNRTEGGASELCAKLLGFIGAL